MQMAARLPARLQYIAGLHPYSWSIIVISLVTGMLWLVQHHINAENVALFSLVAVLLCAVTAGRAPAVFGALVSFLAFKFFFVEPIFTLTVDNITDSWQLFSFVAAALITGALTLHAREQAAMACQQAREMAILYDVSQSISAELDFERIAPVIVDTTRQLLACPASQLVLTGTGDPLFIARGTWPNECQSVAATLHAADQTLGELRVALAPQQLSLASTQQRLLDTLANQAALAL